MANYPDASPNAGAKKAKGMKDNDGRLKGSKSKASFADKKVDNMPNEGAPVLPQLKGHNV